MNLRFNWKYNLGLFLLMFTLIFHIEVCASTIDLSVNKSTQRTYVNLGFDNAENWGLSYQKSNRNTITWMEEENQSNGYINLRKTSQDDMYIDINNIQLLSDNVVFETQIYLEQEHPDIVLYYLRDTATLGTNLNVNLLEIKGNNIETAGQQVAISSGGWHEVSVVMDLVNSCFDVYLDNALVISNVAMNHNMKKPSLWRVYVSGNTNQGTFSVDNMRVYDGVVPRDIEATIPNVTYINNDLDTNMAGFYIQRKQNEINWLQDETSGNGYIQFYKKSTDDMYIDLSTEVTSDYVVFEQDLYLGQEHPDIILFYLRDSVTTNTNVNAGLVEIKNGTINIVGLSNPISTEAWHHISLAVNFANSLCDVYLDEELIFENIPINNALKTVSLWRCYVCGGEKMGGLYIDNYKMYNGVEPRTIDQGEAEISSIFNDVEALALLEGKTAINPYANVIYYEGKKEDVTGSVIIDNEEIFVTLEIINKLFNVECTVATLPTEVTPRLINGVAYIPLCIYGETVMEQGCFLDDSHGMYLISSEPVQSNDNRLKEANLYLFFQRKSADELKQMLMQNTENDLTVHPRVLASDSDFERLRSEINSNSYKSNWFAEIKNKADSLLTRETVRYEIVNGRLLEVSNEVLMRMSVLGMTYQITQDLEYAERAYEELEAICSFEDWNPEHSLDSGTMAMAAAIGYDWIYTTLTPQQKETIAVRLKELGLDTARSAYEGTAAYPSWWTKTETNWGGVVNTGYFNLAIALAEIDVNYAMDIASNALRSMEYAIYRIAPDGAWYEGPGYWSYFLQFLTYTMAGYESAFGENSEILSYMGIDGFAKYQMYFSDPSGNVNNFHDSDEGSISSYGQLYLAEQLGIGRLGVNRISYLDKNSQEASVFDLLWYDIDSTSVGGELPLDEYFAETEFVSMRQNWADENALWVSAHGGYSNNAHDHIDVGTFVMNLGGVRWAVDLPKEMLSYIPDSRNPSIQAGYNSYYFYRRKGEGHNIVVINPDQGLETDQSQFAKIQNVVSGIGRAYASIDLSAAYRSDVSSYTRGYLLSEGRRALTVRDEINLINEDSELYWFMHTKGQIVIIDNQTAIIFQDGKQLKLQFLTDADESELFVMDAEKLPQSPNFIETSNIGIRKIALKLKASGTVNITVKMSLVGEAASQTGPENLPISQWSVEGDEEISEEDSVCEARLTAVQVNGQLLEAFDPQIFNYEYKLEEGETSAVVAATGIGRTEVYRYTFVGRNELVEIRCYDEDNRYTSYVIELIAYEPPLTSQYSRYPVTMASASSEQTAEGNLCGGSCDEDMNTRWSTEGQGEWLLHDLGSIKTIDAIGVALWKGHERNFYFDILVSEDGENFTSLINNYISNGLSEDIEMIELENPISARYIKYIGYGNSVNNWNNVIEMGAYARKSDV